MRISLMLIAGLVVAGVVGCDAGSGGTITVPCDEARCNEACIEEGDEAGSCREDMCVCRPPIDLPSGAQTGLSSGGAVRRESGSYQLDVTVGVNPAGEREHGRRNVEVGNQPGNDPERRVPGP